MRLRRTMSRSIEWPLLNNPMIPMKAVWLLCVAMVLGIIMPKTDAEAEATLVQIPEGQYTPFFLQSPSKGAVPEVVKSVQLGRFALDSVPVSKMRFLDFVRSHPEWRKSTVARVFADESYLTDWPNDLSYGTKDQTAEPVTNISWFAARAFCEAEDMQLPTTDQWEYALYDQGRNAQDTSRIALQWLAEPNAASLHKIGIAKPNGFGVYDLVGLVWEWTEDFDSFVSGNELRASDGKNGAAFCGAGGIGVKDTADYPAFMRFAMRASLKASYTVKNLGFRCAKDL